ncbi:MAG TPA: hypothetical protein P5511_06240, partial [Candidatus Goldiibacteriota bacterium]|nr:hypothetical protein [Candidatus Goldiibacteriota bacterium]
VLIFAAVFFPIVYRLFYFMFSHFHKAPIIGPLLVDRLISAFFMTFSVMTLLSSVVAAIPVLYLSRDIDFLFSSPVSVTGIFAGRAIKIITAAGWMVVLMGFPIFAAYAKVLKLGAGQYLFLMASLLPFCAFLACAGIILTLALVRSFPAENVRNLALALTGIFAAAMIIYFRMLQPEKITGAGFEQVSSFLQSLRTPDSFFLPHTHLVNVIRKAAAGGVMQALSPFMYFLSAACLIFAGTLAAAGRLYFEGFGNRSGGKKEKPLPADYLYSPKPAFISQAKKDMLYLVRDTSQWIQVVFLIGLVFIYLFNLYKLPSELFGLREFIFFLNIAFIGLIMSAVGSRFVLPCVSNEGKSFWVFKAGPVSMAAFLARKTIFFGTPLVAASMAVAFFSLKVLKPGVFVAWLTIFSVFCISCVIACCGAGLGAFFADFEIKNPEDMVTGPAGLAYMFVCFLFTATVLAVESPMIKAYYMSRLIKAYSFNPADYWTNFAAVGIMATVISVLSVKMGIKKLENTEIR